MYETRRMTSSASGQISPNRIETTRLILRPPVYSDGPGLHSLLSDPDVCRYSPFLPFSNIAETHFAIVEWREARDKGLRTYVGASRSDPHTPIGFIQVGLDEELGGVLSPSKSGVGLATEALRVVVETLGLRNAWTIIDAEHTALVHTLAKANIRIQKVLKGYRVYPQISPEKRNCILLKQNLNA
ncbi:GNAT family N-acetyltransferase [Consotaella aegiceratis]|uniref:GNAT family N-acetyltransferase n=1 Tax=Consotaella aegiceratis TaxID=3097961 RepID=UPI002F3E27F2